MVKETNVGIKSKLQSC